VLVTLIASAARGGRKMFWFTIDPAWAGSARTLGAAVQTGLAQRLKPERMVLVGLAVRHLETMPVPADTIVIHGEQDSTVPLADVLDWARPLDLAVVVVPGADHFFHRRLVILRAIVQNNWQRKAEQP